MTPEERAEIRARSNRAIHAQGRTVRDIERSAVDVPALLDENERLRAALERTLHNFESMLAQSPVRDATETLAEARAALGDET